MLWHQERFKTKKIFPLKNLRNLEIVQIYDHRDKNKLICHGFALSDEYILTCEHAIQNNPFVIIKNSRGASTAICLYLNKDLDYALLILDSSPASIIKIKKAKISGITLADNIKGLLRPLNNKMDNSILVANPYSYTESIHKKTKSPALCKSFLIHTESKIKDGDSGLPIINKKGKIVGLLWGTFNHYRKLGLVMPMNLIMNNLLEQISADQPYRCSN